MTRVTIAALRESAIALWQQRQPRERSVLGVGAAVIVAALLYALLIAPALDGRRQLQSALPELRQQAAEMQGLAQQAAQFAGASATAPEVPTSESIEASLREKGLRTQSVAVDGDLVRVQLTAASFAALLEWLAEAQHTARLVVLDASIVAQPAPDSVNATLTLRQQKSGGV